MFLRNSFQVIPRKKIENKSYFHTTGNSCKDTLSCRNYPGILPAGGDASWLLLSSMVSLLSGGTLQPENTNSCILKVTGQVWESQKRIGIKINLSYHQCSSPWLSLNWSNDSGSVLTNPIGKDGVGGWLIFIMTPSLERWPAKANKASSPHEVRLTLLETNLIFQCLIYNLLYF